MQKFNQSRVLSEKVSCPELGEIVKEGNRVTFTMKIETEGFSNMQEVKEFLRNNRGKMQNIIKKYCELKLRARHTDGMFEKKEHKAVEAIMKRLGYL